MEIAEFLKILYNADPDFTDTGFYNVNVKTNKDKTIKTIYRVEKCKHCNTTIKHEVIVVFKKPIDLTVFQAELLFALFCLNKKPHDYGKHHNTIAGKEFIENIKDVLVLKEKG